MVPQNLVASTLGRIVALAHTEGGALQPAAQPSIGRLTKVTYSTSTSADAARPTSVRVNGSTLISNITYDLEGEPQAWDARGGRRPDCGDRLGGSSSWQHGVEKDAVGRVTRTWWEVNNVKQNDVRYTYEGDGEILSESDLD